ncbi:MAG: integrase core domain-containing protein, partial [Thiobacillus sp.]
ATLSNQAHGAFADFGGILYGFLHGSIFSRVGASSKSGAVQSLPSARVIRTLERIIEWRGRPEVIRCDNGPEYISGALLAWAETHQIRIEHIQPGKPQQNAYVERYNRTVRYDWLGQYLFDSIEEVQESATRWLWSYNHERPNMALGGITPMQKLMLAN